MAAASCEVDYRALLKRYMFLVDECDQYAARTAIEHAEADDRRILEEIMTDLDNENSKIWRAIYQRWEAER